MAFNSTKFKFVSLSVLIVVLIIVIIVLCVTMPKQANKNLYSHIPLEKVVWIRGATNCAIQIDPLIQTVRYDRNTWIFRQNKCIHYEAPFMYLFVGRTKSLLIDTGATEDEQKMPLYRKVNGVLKSRNMTGNPLIVAHSHSHADHYAGDGQFKGKTNVSVVGLEVDDIKTFFDIHQWPNGEAEFDLGERMIKILPIPGHQEASLAFYDSASKLLVTGDTFYVGRLYVFDWTAFKDSISRLYDFASKHEISYIVGTHIEMSVTPGVDYPVESTYHPEEQKLPLTVAELGSLNESLQKATDIYRIVFDKFIVVPR